MKTKSNRVTKNEKTVCQKTSCKKIAKTIFETRFTFNKKSMYVKVKRKRFSKILATTSKKTRLYKDLFVKKVINK